MVDYGATVASLWPEFAANGKVKLAFHATACAPALHICFACAQEAITVTQVLSHQAGLASAISPVTPMRELTDWDAMLARVAAAAPDALPASSTCRYHIMSFKFIMAGIVQAVSGRHIRDVVRTDIALPLGIADELMMGLSRLGECAHSRAAHVTLHRW